MARTKLSEYQKYLNRRRKLEAEGYSLDDVLTETEVNQYAKLLKNNIEAGKISPIKNIGAYIANDDKYFNKNQVNKLKKGLNDMYKAKGMSKRITAKDIYSRSKDLLDDINEFNKWKLDKTLIGGHYE